MKFAIKTLGCKVNQYESQVLRENLERFGLREADAKAAEAVIVNSCTVTEQADIKSRKIIRKVKKENPAAKIFVTGCGAVRDEDIDSLESMPEVHEVIPNLAKMRLPLLLRGSRGARQDNKVREHISGFKSHTRAFVKIQDGCDQDCSYCKIRVVRGRARSRGSREILDEIKRLAAHGYREIVLTGICLGAWKGADGEGLPGLLKRADRLKGGFRIRLSSIEPNHIDDELIKTMASSSRICRHLHIPVQSGSDRILALMKRRYNTSQFRGCMDNIRSRMPLAGITMDVIAGFPGETDNDFDRSLEFIKGMRPSRLHVFRYSARKGTLAADMEDRVPSRDAKQRVERLIKLGTDLQAGFCGEFIEREVEVLIEGKPEGAARMAYTSEYVKTRLSGFSGREGDLVRVKPSGVDKNTPCLLAGIADLV